MLSIWEFTIESLTNPTGQKFVLSQRGVPLSYSQVVSLWASDIRFRGYFSELVKDSPYLGFRWETPAVSLVNSHRNFEFVLLRCDELERPVDRSAFSEYFETSSSVVTFANLRGDATLVVPCPLRPTEDSTYCHLARFLRESSAAQIDALWKSIGLAMQDRINNRSVWLSTAGMGVAWLHIRLDDRPKYYGYAPYRSSG